MIQGGSLGEHSDSGLSSRQKSSGDRSSGDQQGSGDAARPEISKQFFYIHFFFIVNSLIFSEFQCISHFIEFALDFQVDAVGSLLWPKP